MSTVLPSVVGIIAQILVNILNGLSFHPTSPHRIKVENKIKLNNKGGDVTNKLLKFRIYMVCYI
jgi:hypothetical protein